MPEGDSRYWIAKFLDIRDGHKCALKDETCKGSLVIDHINGNRLDRRPENLRWLCVSHNRREGIRSRVSERENNYDEGSPEMKVNINTEPAYRAWLIEEVIRKEYVAKDEAINAGAEKFELSPTTTRKHLSKLTSSLGPLKEVKDRLLGKVVKLKGTEELKQA